MTQEKRNSSDRRNKERRKEVKPVAEERRANQRRSGKDRRDIKPSN
jgi:hypothetical protein